MDQRQTKEMADTAAQLIDQVKQMLRENTMSGGEILYYFPYTYTDCECLVLAYAGYYWDNENDLVFYQVDESKPDRKGPTKVIARSELQRGLVFKTRQEAEAHRLQFAIKALESRVASYLDSQEVSALSIRATDTWYNEKTRPLPPDFVSKLNPPKPKPAVAATIATAKPVNPLPINTLRAMTPGGKKAVEIITKLNTATNTPAEFIAAGLTMAKLKAITGVRWYRIQELFTRMGHPIPLK